MSFGLVNPRELVDLSNVDYIEENKLDPLYNNVTLHLKGNDPYNVDKPDYAPIVLFHCIGGTGSYFLFNSASLLSHSTSTSYNGRLTTENYKIAPSSAYFDGTTGSYEYTVLAPANYGNLGTGDFTIAAWINTTQTGTSNIGCISGFGTNAGFWELGTVWDATTKFHFGYYASSAYRVLGVTTSVSDGLWHHIAVTRKSGTLRLFLDGVIVASTSTYGNFQCGGSFSIVAGSNAKNATGDYIGYMQEMLVYNNYALWDSDFDPPLNHMLPHTTVQDVFWYNTMMHLTFDNNTNNSTFIYDNKKNFSAWTRSGTGSYVTNTDKATGNGCYTLTTTSTSGFYTNDNTYRGDLNFNNPAIDWTIEFYVKVDFGTSTSFVPLYMAYITPYVFSDKIRVVIRKSDNTGDWTYDYNTTTPNNQWFHVAICRLHMTLYCYLNGTHIGSPKTLSEFGMYGGTNTPWIGGKGASNNPGKVDQIRTTEGICRYFTDFNVTTKYLENSSIQNKIKDYSKFNNVLSPTTGSLRNSKQLPFKNKKDLSISVNDVTLTNYEANSIHSITTQDFTMEGWLYTSNANTNQVLFQLNAWAANSCIIYVNHASYTNKVSFWLYNANSTTPIIVSTSDISYNKWNHIAVTRNDQVFKLFINGVLEGIATSSAAVTSTTAKVFIGDNIIGYLHDIRITKGISRYLSNFSVPTTSFPLGG